MTVRSTHADYEAAALGWSHAPDVLAGEDVVKAAGEKYLPRMDSQSEEKYAACRARASFFGASARTADGYLGLIFRSPPLVKIPKETTLQGVLTPDASPNQVGRGAPESVCADALPLSLAVSPPDGERESELGHGNIEHRTSNSELGQRRRGRS